jgi:hypothetical protein
MMQRKQNYIEERFCCLLPCKVRRPPELEHALERQQGKGSPANAIATQSFEVHKNQPLLTMRSNKRHCHTKL